MALNSGLCERCSENRNNLNECCGVERICSTFRSFCNKLGSRAAPRLTFSNTEPMLLVDTHLELTACMLSHLCASTASWCPRSNSTVGNRGLLLCKACSRCFVASPLLSQLELLVGRGDHRHHLPLGSHRPQLPTRMA